MRILVTGGLGFIGGRLSLHLRRGGHQVVVGTRLAGKAPDWLDGIEVVHTAWGDAEALQRICVNVDTVIHTAGMSARDCALDPSAALEFNGEATKRLVRASHLQRVKRFIYLSTAHVYSSPLEGTVNEATYPRNTHPYATSHRAGEDAVLAARQLGEIEGINLRLSNVYGPPATKEVNCWKLLVNDLCRQAVESRRLVLHSNGLQERDFITMTETCRLIGLLATDNSTGKFPAIVNLGAGLSRSITGMAQLVQDRCHLKLGFRPGIENSHRGSAETLRPLRFDTDALSNAGIKVAVDSAAETDQLLEFCQAAFSVQP